VREGGLQEQGLGARGARGFAARRRRWRARPPSRSPRPPSPLRAPAGVVAVDLGRSLLQIYPDTYILVVSHENLTSNW
jgi:hypothetical protein